MAEASAAGAARQAWDVGALLLATGDLLQARFGAVTVRGELSGLTRAASGHCYFALKDMAGAGALLRCAMFRRAAVAAGLRRRRTASRSRCAAACRCTSRAANCSWWSSRCSALGAGALYEQFLRLKARLEAAGLFDAVAQARHRRLAVDAGHRHLHRGGRAARRAGRAGAARAACARGRSTRARCRAPTRPPRWWRRCSWRRRGARSTRCCWCAAAARWRTCGPSTTSAGARHRGVADPGGLRRRPRDRRDAGRPGRRPARATPTAAAELAAPVRAEALARLDALAERLQRRVHHWSDTQAQRLDALALRLGGPARALARAAPGADGARRAPAPGAARMRGRCGARPGAARRAPACAPCSASANARRSCCRPRRSAWRRWTRSACWRAAMPGWPMRRAGRCRRCSRRQPGARLEAVLGRRLGAGRGAGGAAAGSRGAVRRHRRDAL